MIYLDPIELSRLIRAWLRAADFRSEEACNAEVLLGKMHFYLNI
jgi:hypothetical protein